MNHISEPVNELMLYWERQLDRFTYKINCPECHEVNIHIQNVAVNQNGNISMVTSSGTQEYSGPSDQQRGAIICIMFACESGHRFAWKFQFDKGETFYSEEILKPNDLKENQNSLWRD